MKICVVLSHKIYGNVLEQQQESNTGGHYYLPNFSDKKIEAQVGKGTF